MKLPSPRETLAGCVWLPRLLAKARQFQRGELPPDYAARFCRYLSGTLRSRESGARALAVAELRRFYRLSEQRKVRHIERTG